MAFLLVRDKQYSNYGASELDDVPTLVNILKLPLSFKEFSKE